jgi:hypothetical protein
MINDASVACGWAKRLVPIGEDPFGLLDLLLQSSEVEPDFSGPSRDLNFNGCEAAPLHAQVELLMGFVNAVLLETIHG